MPQPAAWPAFTSPLQALPAILPLEHPQEIDPVTLSGAGLTVALFGITALPDPGHGLQAHLQAQGDRVSCEPHLPAPGTAAGALPRYT